MSKLNRSMGRGLARRVVWPVRRVMAPGALEVPELAGEVEQLRAALEECRSRIERSESRVEALEQRLRDVHEDGQESRLLNIRVAELTDVVTELVLPLHDRDVNPDALRALRPETR